MLFTIENGCSIQPPEVVGGKAHNLMKLRHRGVPVPNAFVISTDMSLMPEVELGGFKPNSTFLTEVKAFTRWIGVQSSKQWAGDQYTGKYDTPLLVSVRSGAPVSMPGMMDTVLNVGLTSENIETFENKVFALDAYRRLIQMYASTVCGVKTDEFREIHDAAGIFFLERNEVAARLVVKRYLEVFKREVGEDFPDDANTQLFESINAVFRSWNSDRAKAYRQIEGISDDMGTAVTVQEMVYGNLDELSGTGVVFSHNPNTGESGLYGDFLCNAQGEDVVSGSYNTIPISQMKDLPDFLQAYKSLRSWVNKLVSWEDEMLDIEFTIESGKLHILQQRVAKRSSRADIGFILNRVAGGQTTVPNALEKIMSRLPAETGTTDPGDLTPVGTGVGTGHGTICAKVAVGHDEADKLIAAGEKYIYVAKETNPDDVMWMSKSIGLLTAQGGVVSHAAVIARNWNIPAVVGFSAMEVYDDYIVIGDKRIASGELLKINAHSGEVWA